MVGYWVFLAVSVALNAGAAFVLSGAWVAWVTRRKTRKHLALVDVGFRMTEAEEKRCAFYANLDNAEIRRDTRREEEPKALRLAHAGHVGAELGVELARLGNVSAAEQLRAQGASITAVRGRVERGIGPTPGSAFAYLIGL